MNSSSTGPSSSSIWKHAFTLEDSHLDMLKACLSYLQLEIRYKSPIDDDDGYDDELLQLAQNHPFLSYASINWTFHFRQAGEKVNKDLGGRAVQLCDITSREFLLWFRMYNAERFVEQPETDFMAACYFGLATAMQLLLDGNSGIGIESKGGSFEQTPLSHAAENGYEDIVKLLLATGQVDVNSKNCNGQTPLSWASGNGYEAIVKLLLETGNVDVDSKNNHSGTPLLLAAWSGHDAVVKLLLETGKVDLDSKDYNGQTPLSVALENGYEATIRLLLGAGAKSESDKDSAIMPSSYQVFTCVYY
jgi:hypothetical protein